MPSPSPSPTHKQQAEQEAIRRATDQLHSTDLSTRCLRLKLPPPDAQATIRVTVFGQTLALHPPTFEATVEKTGQPAKPADRLLALHYLLCETDVAATGEWISFRDFPGGQFYWQPFLSRTIEPLVQRVGNDLARLRTACDRLTWQAVTQGDFAARFQAVGALDLLLVYRLGDEEFTPTADLLFDAALRRVYGAEDAAVLASRLCLGLLR